VLCLFKDFKPIGKEKSLGQLEVAVEDGTEIGTVVDVLFTTPPAT
jgi:sporulation protein YlmC with PRC-barrel domain